MGRNLTLGKKVGGLVEHYDKMLLSKMKMRSEVAVFEAPKNKQSSSLQEREIRNETTF